MADVRGVVVLGDFLRPDAQGKAGGSDRPTRWLYNAVRRQIGAASALPVSLATATQTPEIAAWLAAERPPAAAEAWWAARYGELPDPPPWLPALLHQRFCLTYEAPPYLTALLHRLQVPWLDVRIHPVRFLDDLLFAARASERATQAALLRHAVPESLVVATVGLREAMALLIADAALPQGTLLVIGQRPLDATQIVDGRFFDAFDHAAAIHRLCAGYAAVVLKPHPSGDHHSLLIVAANAPARVLGTIADNLYQLLALPQIAAVLTVNSSAAVEARYFGKRVHTLAALPAHLLWRGDDVDRTGHVSLDDMLLTPDFWRLVLAPHTPVSAADAMRLPAKPNRLRIALDSFWDYQQIDTDRIPRPRL